MHNAVLVVYQVSNGYVLQVGGSGEYYIFSTKAKLNKAMKEVLAMNEHSEEETH